ncbi:family 2 glycosyl transferase [Candidatus Atribacteria bacterium HGW-Atribacteria-1]|nr:MAG: family 2 glycosyl transferase [Candidatus Atribacteria bacterium HGW-Atribacteria-1]
MISAVCVYNNEKILNDYLLKSLKNQTVDYEIIALDNTQRKYKSAAEALNYGGRKAKGDYIMFVHQDIILGSDLWIEKAEKILDKLPNFGIAGVAGRCENTEGIITNIENGVPKRAAGEIHIKKPIKVQTVDECLIIIPKSVFSILQFDEKICNDWHLYAIDYSLSIRRLEYNVYVMPMYVYHLSTGFKPIGKLERILRGPLQRGYYLSLKKVLNKHKNYYEKIYTTCGIYRTAYPLFLQRGQSMIKNRFKLLLKKIMVKKV